MALNPGRKIRKLTWRDIEKLLDNLILAIGYDEKRKDYNSIYGIPRNGVIIAGLLAHKMNLPIANEYTFNKDTLVVDDISDSGNTLQNFISLKKHLGIKDIETVTFFYRKNTTFMPTYSLEDIKDKWIQMPWEVE